MLAWWGILAEEPKIETGNPILDAALGYGLYGLIIIATFLLCRFMYQQRETDRTAADTAQAEIQAKREADWVRFQEAWEKERDDLFKFRDTSRGEWDKERLELVRQLDLARSDAAEARKTANEAMGGVRSFLETGQKEYVSTLREVSATLHEAALKERALEETLKAKERENDMLRTVNDTLQEQLRRMQGGGS